MSHYKEDDYFTIVFKIDDKQEFAQHGERMMAAMATGERIYGAHVVAAGIGNKAIEREALAEFVLREHDEAPDGIVQSFIDEENRRVEDL